MITQIAAATPAAGGAGADALAEILAAAEAVAAGGYAPNVLNGGPLEVPSGSFNFRFEGPDELQVEPDGRIVLFQSQPRPRLPSR